MLRAFSFPQLMAMSDLSMLPSSPASCTSPNPDKKVHWDSEKRRRTSSTDSESKSHLDISKLPRSRRPSRLTVKYDRGHLQRWLEMEQWVDAQVQELFQGQEAPEPEIDLEALMELSTEEQRTQLEAILQDCPCDREPFISELLSQLKKLRRLSRPSK
ncbi:protein phosphatase 1 regulatory subunit 14D [Mesocricetus auratus]|uniref:Protein phosphatase 1 regulatory subunit 14 n=1 Tax=Mesocricetus auratus TaxID=10036 RepID=A0A1U7Q340_MESAU|nr:protein phosphatase 1 regulatory subunit 14D [Mesocricetus auratus]